METKFKEREGREILNIILQNMAALEKKVSVTVMKKEK